LKTQDARQDDKGVLESLSSAGFAITGAGDAARMCKALIESAFESGCPGKRCLLDQPAVAEAAMRLRRHLVSQGLLTDRATAIQAIAFDKMPESNWKVAWHQDLMFPFAKPVTSPGFETPSVKDGIPFARPPLWILQDLLAVRLHLDDCGAANGPLRVSPGTHRLGILPSESVADYVRHHGQVECPASEGEVLLMRPLLLHASSEAREPNHRRVLHFVFHSGTPIPEHWAQKV
jgi:ectoine hydroxylase-related dioxygenase (phytanoyl-CoA dioxygenase family)